MGPKVNMQLMMNEPRCCCGARIRIGVIAAAIIGTIYSAITAVSYASLIFISMNSKEVGYIAWPVISLHAISLLLYISVMYVTKKDKACAYLPYLILQGIVLVVRLILTVFSVIYCILVATAVATVDIGYHPNDETAARAVGITFMIIMIAFLLFAFILEAYLYSVIWRAYMFTKDFVEPNRFGQVQRVGLATGSTVTPDASKVLVIL